MVKNLTGALAPMQSIYAARAQKATTISKSMHLPLIVFLVNLRFFGATGNHFRQVRQRIRQVVADLKSGHHRERRTVAVHLNTGEAFHLA